MTEMEHVLAAKALWTLVEFTDGRLDANVVLQMMQDTSLPKEDCDEIWIQMNSLTK